MRYARQIIFLVLLASQFPVFCQHPDKKGHEVPVSFCISPMDYKLYTMINDYRARYDLPPIPLSKSLSYVASVHVKDLFLNHPDRGSCNSHSWSASGHWKPFCYPRDENKKNSVWDKPKELTNYKGKGYEIVYWENSAAVIDSVITFWKSVDYFNSFLMNTGKWNGKRWNAIGVSIFENYAVAWFGELSDQESGPVVCGSVPADNPKQDVTKKESQKKDNPKSVQSKTETLKTENITAETQKTEPPKKENSKSENPKKTTEPQVQTDVLQSPSGRFYIVVKSQSPRNEMVKALDDLRRQGYSEVKLLKKDDKLRVSILDYATKPSADSALRLVKKTFKDAWILKY